MLFTFAGGSGHLHPLLPIGRAAQLAGHMVAFLGSRSLAATVEAAGFTIFGVGSGSPPPSRRVALVDPDPAREQRVVRSAYADRFARRRVADLLGVAPDWQPDVIVCDEMDFGAMIAAEMLALPHVTVIVIAAGGFARPDVVAESLDRVRADFGLPPDPDVRMPGRHLVIEPIPPGFRDPSDPLPDTAHAIRPTDPVTDISWERGADDRPLLYFTLGTIFNLESGDLFDRVLTGLHDLPLEVVVTVGREIDPAEFGPQPDHIRIERFIPQAAILPHCDVVVSHGGSGTVIGALAQGLPQVLIPLGADQLLTGPRCEALGIGRALHPVTLTSADVAAAVTDVMTDPAYRANAERMQRASDALPGPASAVELIEALERG